MVSGVRVELAEVAALVRHADVGQSDAHQPRGEEHHLETVVLQGWGGGQKQWGEEEVGYGGGGGRETAWDGRGVGKGG